MNDIIKVLSVALLTICSKASGHELDAGQAALAAAPLPPGPSPAEASATLMERVKFGYESDGWGSRLSQSLHQRSNEQLKCMAATGDAGAAKVMWFRLADASDTELTHMPEAEEIALEQFRLIGHTFLIYMTAGRYKHRAEEECGFPDNSCRTGNARFQKAAAWYKLGEKLGDPVSAMGFSKLGRHVKLDAQAADLDAEVLSIRTLQLPGAVDTFAHQCRATQE